MLHQERLQVLRILQAEEANAAPPPSRLGTSSPTSVIDTHIVGQVVDPVALEEDVGLGSILNESGAFVDYPQVLPPPASLPHQVYVARHDVLPPTTSSPRPLDVARNGVQASTRMILPHYPFHM